MPGSSASSVSTTVPTCTDRAEVAAEDRPTQPGDLDSRELRNRPLRLADDEGPLAQLLVDGPPAIDGRASYTKGRRDVFWAKAPLQEACHSGTLLLQSTSLDALTLSPRSGSSRHDISGTPSAGEVQWSAHFSVGEGGFHQFGDLRLDRAAPLGDGVRHGPHVAFVERGRVLELQG